MRMLLGGGAGCERRLHHGFEDSPENALATFGHAGLGHGFAEQDCGVASQSAAALEAMEDQSHDQIADA